MTTYQCKVCDKVVSMGDLTKHLHTHEKHELIPFVAWDFRNDA